MDEPRDTELGRQLEAFGEPEHGVEYWRDVRRAVAEAKDAAAAEARRPGFWRRLRTAFAPRRVRLACAAAAVAVVVAAALLAGLPRTRGPESVSAAEVLDRALTAYSSFQTWEADLHLKWYEQSIWTTYRSYLTRRAHLLSAADGSSRGTWSPVTAAGHILMEGGPEVWDATTGIGGGYDGSEGMWGVVKNGALGPPDAGTVPFVDMATTVRALASSRVLRLDETVVDGRPAWTVSCTRAEMAGLPPSGEDDPVYTVLVDKQTWMLLGVDEVTAGRLTFSGRYRNVRVDQPLPDDAFTFEAPPGVHLTPSDGGFHRMTLDKAAATPGVTPLVPGWGPSGYELTLVAVADHAVITRDIGGAEVAFSTRDVFALQYTRGFDQLTVSTRVVRDADYSVDIDICDEGDQDWSKRARTEAAITSGAFAGVTARTLVASTTSVPHLWAVKDGVLLTIAGMATAEELLAMAESLQAYPSPSPAAE